MRGLVGFRLLALVAIIPLAAGAAPPVAMMAWERTQIRAEVAVSGYDVSPDGGTVAIGVCRNDGACLIAMHGPAGSKVLRPPDSVSWREPRFIDGHSLLVLAVPADRGAWSSERTALVRIDVRTGRSSLLLEAGFVSSATFASGDLCFAEATGGVDLPLAPGPQKKPVRFAMFCAAADGSGRRRLGAPVFDSVADLTPAPGLGLVFNGMASSYGGQTINFAVASSGGPPADTLMAVDLRSGVVQPLASRQPGLAWFAGQDPGGAPLVGRSADKVWRRPLRSRASTLSPLSSGKVLARTTGMRPGVIRTAPGGGRGLLLLNDAGHAPDWFDLAWIDHRTGVITRDAPLTAVVLSAWQSSR